MQIRCSPMPRGHFLYGNFPALNIQRPISNFEGIDLSFRRGGGRNPDAIGDRDAYLAGAFRLNYSPVTSCFSDKI